MSTRKLQFERLESRLLLSADWPAGEGFYKDVLVNGGAYLSSRGLYADNSLGLTADNFLTSSSSRTASVFGGNAADSNGILLYPDGQPRYQVVFSNGGSATDHVRALTSKGRQVFRDYFAEGGSYTGSCAGAFITWKYSGYLNLWPGAMGHNAGRSGSMSVNFEDQEHPFTQILIDRAGTSTIKSIPHYYGPIFSEKYSHPEDTEFLGNIYSASGSIYRSRNTPYLISYKPTEESGRLVVQPSHPEGYSSGDKLALMESIILYAMSGTQDIPDLKGELSINQDVTGRVGDKQYHRYTVNVGTEIDKLSIGLEGNAKLFVQHDSYAHSQSSLSHSNVFNIDDPELGLWHISVYGDHTIRNGTPYTLTVSDTTPSPPPPPLPPTLNYVVNFNSGLPVQNWTYNSTGAGRIYNSNGRMRMDTTVNGKYELNEAILHLDLSKYSSITLSFNQAWHKDELHRLPSKFSGSYNGDGVSISSDGITWYSLPHVNGDRTIDLGRLDSYIKFQQYDNYSSRYDGRSWDNITLSSGKG
jgi:hypothetical protein